MFQKTPQKTPELSLSPDQALEYLPRFTSLTTIRIEDGRVLFRTWHGPKRMLAFLHAQDLRTFGPSVPYSKHAVVSLAASARDPMVPVTIYAEVLGGRLVRDEFIDRTDRFWKEIAEYEARGVLHPSLANAERGAKRMKETAKARKAKLGTKKNA